MRPEKLYLTDIVEAAEALEKFCSGVTFEQFLDDEMRQAAVLQKLIVIGEAASRLPDAFHVAHADIPWADIVGFRNIAVHEYFAVRWNIVWTTATMDVPGLKPQIEALLRQAG